MQDPIIQNSPEEIQTTILKLKEFIVNLEFLPDQKPEYTEIIIEKLSELLANKKHHKCKLQITSDARSCWQSNISLDFYIADKKVYITTATYDENRNPLPIWSPEFY